LPGRGEFNEAEKGEVKAGGAQECLREGKIFVPLKKAAAHQKVVIDCRVSWGGTLSRQKHHSIFIMNHYFISAYETRKNLLNAHPFIFVACDFLNVKTLAHAFFLPQK